MREVAKPVPDQALVVGIAFCLPEPLTLLAEEVTAGLREISAAMLHRSIGRDYILLLVELSTFWEATQGKQTRIGEKPLCMKMSIALCLLSTRYTLKSWETYKSLYAGRQSNS